MQHGTRAVCLHFIGAGSSLFQVQGNQVIADKDFRKEEQASYNFELIYTHSGIQHIEDVQVDLSRFMQSQGSFVADEAQMVLLSAGEFDLCLVLPMIMSAVLMG